MWTRYLTTLCSKDSPNHAWQQSAGSLSNQWNCFLCDYTNSSQENLWAPATCFSKGLETIATKAYFNNINNINYSQEAGFGGKKKKRQTQNNHTHQN